MLALLRARLHDFLHRHKGAVVGLALTYPAQLKTVFFHLHPCRVSRVHRQLQGGCVDADATLRVGLDGLGKVLAQDFQALRGRGGRGEDGM